jgi:hypothetical protein
MLRYNAPPGLGKRVSINRQILYIFGSLQSGFTAKANGRYFIFRSCKTVSAATLSISRPGATSKLTFFK